MDRKLVDFFLTAGKLKTTERFGWTKYKIAPESVADHSWRTALIAYVLAKRLKLDDSKAVKMALVHDLAEVKTGDIPRNSVPMHEKERREAEALKAIVIDLEPKEARELSKLCDEYQKRKSKIAKLVRDADNLDMILQALEYEKSDKTKLDEFFETEFLLPETKALAKEIKARRSQRD